MDASALPQVIHSLGAEDGFRPRLDDKQWQTLTQYLMRRPLESGEVLIRQGERDRSLYVLAQGNLQVRQAGAALAILRAGAICGESGLFGEGLRLADVEALTPCIVFVLRLPRFEELAARFPLIGLEVVRAAGAVMASRTHQQLKHLEAAARRVSAG